MKKISFFIFVISFFLYRPYTMQQFGMLYRGDDPQYFSYSTSMAFFEFPSFEKELTDTVQAHPIGSGILAAPFVFAFSMIDRIIGSSIVDERNWDNVEASWTLFGFVFSSVFYFWLSNFFAYKGLRLYFSEKYSVLAIIVMILIQGVPLYVYRRPVFSHIYEFFLQSVLVYILLWCSHRDNHRQNGYIFIFLISLIIGMVALVRYNNITIALFWPIAIWSVHDNEFVLMKNWKNIVLTYLILFVPFIVFIGLPQISNDNTSHLFIIQNILGVMSSTKIMLLSLININRWKYVLFGYNWGLFYTAPFILISIFSSLYFKADYRKALIMAMVPLAFNFIYLVITWRTPGSWYGYRYFFFSAIPVLLLPIAGSIQYFERKFGQIIYLPLLLLSLLPLLSMLCFEGNSDNLTLHTGYKIKWLGGWDNPTYQLEVWKTLLFQPKAFLVAVLKGGPLYSVYLLTLIFNIKSLLPGIVFEKYPYLEIKVFIKSIIIYIIPFISYFIFSKFRMIRK